MEQASIVIGIALTNLSDHGRSRFHCNKQQGLKIIFCQGKYICWVQLHHLLKADVLAEQDASKGAETKGIDTDAKKGSKRAKLEDKREKQTAAHAEKQRQAQLELLLMDDKALQDAVRVGERHLAVLLPLGCSMYIFTNASALASSCTDQTQVLTA